MVKTLKPSRANLILARYQAFLERKHALFCIPAEEAIERLGLAQQRILLRVRFPRTSVLDNYYSSWFPPEEAA